MGRVENFKRRKGGGHPGIEGEGVPRQTRGEGQIKLIAGRFAADLLIHTPPFSPSKPTSPDFPPPTTSNQPTAARQAPPTPRLSFTIQKSPERFENSVIPSTPTLWIFFHLLGTNWCTRQSARLEMRSSDEFLDFLSTSLSRCSVSQSY